MAAKKSPAKASKAPKASKKPRTKKVTMETHTPILLEMPDDMNGVLHCAVCKADMAEDRLRDKVFQEAAWKVGDDVHMLTTCGYCMELWARAPGVPDATAELAEVSVSERMKEVTTGLAR